MTAHIMNDLGELREWFNELPVVTFLSLTCTDLEQGTARLLLHAPDSLRNPDGATNGGLIAAAADLGAGIAASSCGPEFLGSATGDLSIHFVGAARISPLTLEATVLRQGRRSCVPHVRISDATGKLCAVATGTWVLRPSAETSAPVPAAQQFAAATQQTTERPEQ